MAIFQPSNITPSSFAGVGGGTVAVADMVNISWQVNGNSPLTGFQIDIYNNDATSGLVYTSGVITLDAPFYGVDSKGNPQFFVYSPNQSWGELTNSAMTDGNSYKLKITQYWGENNANSIEQYSESAFITRSVPTLTVYWNGQAFSDSVVVDSAVGDFTAVYSQAQGDTINWVRWQIASVDNGVNNVLEDTGPINTSVLSYSYDGLLTGEQYAISCTIESENGVQVSSGWIVFEVQYAQALTSGDLTIECLPNEDAVLLSWGAASNIQGTATPADGYTIDGEEITLNEGANIVWDTVGSDAMNIAPQYTVAWKGEIPQATTYLRDIATETSMLGVGYAAFSSNGEYAVFANNFATAARVYKITNGVFSLIDTAYLPNEAGYVSALALSPDGSSLIVGGTENQALSPNATSACIVSYQVSGSSVLRLDTIEFTANTGVFPRVNDVKFSFDGKYLVVGGSFNGYAVYFNVSDGIGTTYNQIKKGNIPLDGEVKTIAFSRDYSQGNTFVLGGDFAGYASAFILTSSEGLIYQTDISASSASIPLGSVTGTVFSPSGDSLVLSGLYNDRIWTKTFKANSSSSYTYTGDLFDIINGERQGSSQLAFSTDGNLLFVGDLTFTFNDTSSTATFLYEVFINNQAFRNVYTVNVSDDMLIISNLLGTKAAVSIFEVNSDTSTHTVLTLSETDLTISYNLYQIMAKQNGRSLHSVSIRATANNALVAIGNDTLNVYQFLSDGQIWSSNRRLVYSQNSITSVRLDGEQVCDWVFITQGTYDFVANNYTPQWGGTAQFFANFKNDLQAGTLAASGSIVNAIYRKGEDDTRLQSVLRASVAVDKLKDYGIRSGVEYNYELFYQIDGGVYSAPVISAPVCKRFRAYSLIEAKQDSQYPNVYRVQRVFRFGNNVNAGSVSNNNTPNWLINFTPYRLRQPVRRLGKSGTLQALLSNIKNGTDYEDTVSMQEALFNASVSDNSFFLKDMKGNLYMVHISSPIVQTIDTKTTQQKVSVSVPWEEIGEADNISLIQTPEDSGWIRNEVAEVSMNVSLDNGVLSAKYPNGYKGDTFTLINTALYAETPNGMEMPSYELSDGELAVTVDDE